MAVVSQDTFIFNTSVWNIAYGTRRCRWEKLAANALEFILEMPEGFETKLGDGESGYLEVSVIAIARACRAIQIF